MFVCARIYIYLSVRCACERGKQIYIIKCIKLQDKCSWHPYQFFAILIITRDTKQELWTRYAMLIITGDKKTRIMDAVPGYTGFSQSGLTGPWLYLNMLVFDKWTGTDVTNNICNKVLDWDAVEIRSTSCTNEIRNTWQIW